VAAGGPPTAGTGVTGVTGVIGKLGTFVRTEGTTQVTYDGPRLCCWQGDAKPGDTTGDGVNGFSVAKVGGTAPVPSVSVNPGYSLPDAQRSG
jgi:Secreted repeat of unknown function.